MLVDPPDFDEATRLFNGLPNISLMEMAIDDIWIRDTGPTFVFDEMGGLHGIDWNFNCWGGKGEPFQRDRYVARRMTEALDVPCRQAALVCEGGGFHVDGEGTMIASESCMLNDNRNPGKDRAYVEAVFHDLVGVDKVIWIPGGDCKDDITDGHVDGICFFTRPGAVIAQVPDDPDDPEYGIMQENLKALENATDARNRRLDVKVVRPPRREFVEKQGRYFASMYVNCFVTGGGVVMPVFGDPERDEAAITAIGGAFPGRRIIPLRIDRIASGGGGIHCITLQEPRIPARLRT